MRNKHTNQTCETPKCRKPKAPHRRKCFSCIQKQYAERHPIRYIFNTNKQNAKRRGKFWDLTYQQFEMFCLQHNYHLEKGITPRSMTIDRINSSLGYSLDNIQPLTMHENSSKCNRDCCADVPF